jgi:U3 small nucleolar RNA-associated protein 25
VKHVLFYGLPDYAHFYPELLNHMQDEELTCTVLYNKYDRLKLERIVGIPVALKLLQSPRDKITI